MRAWRCVALVVSLLALAAASRAQDRSMCVPPWSSGGVGDQGCAIGQVCADLFGARLEVLAGDEQLVAVRDLDKRYCAGRKTRRDVVYTTGQDFRWPDCVLPAAWLQDFAAYPEGCYRPATVLTVAAGVITLRPARGTR